LQHYIAWIHNCYYKMYAIKCIHRTCMHQLSVIIYHLLTVLSLSLSVDCVFVFACDLFPYLLLSKQVVPAFRDVCDLEIGRIGPIIHETLHTFGLVEMYDVEAGYGTGNIGGIDR
jgi:hypothetical protein